MTKLLLSILIACLLLIVFNQQNVPEPPNIVPTRHATINNTPTPEQAAPLPLPHKIVRERVYWQESPEYYHWRTSVKSSIEDAALPEYSGRWVREYYWTWR